MSHLFTGGGSDRMATSQNGRGNPAHSRKMDEIYRELCVPFVNQLKARTHDAGGDPGDIAILSAKTLRGTIEICFAAPEREKALELISQLARITGGWQQT